MERKTVQVVDHLPVPRLRIGYLLVRVVCVALNPCDAKVVFQEDLAGMNFGTDYSGIVAETGYGYSKDWQKGDRIFGVIMGANPLQPTDGAFAEYAVVKADVQYRMPHYMTFETAASLGVGLGTAALGICHKLNLKINLDDEDDTKDQGNKHVFIYGGSTATGTISIQLLRQAGYIPITTCSPKNFDLVKSYGAEAAFDYQDPRCGQKILSFTRSKFTCAFDTISDRQSARLCADVLSNDPSSAYCSTLPVSEPFQKKAIVPKRLLLWSGLGEPINFMGYTLPVVFEDFAYLKEWTFLAEALLEERELTSHPVRFMHNGWEGIWKGLERIQNSQVSGEKLVYTLSNP
ncbi:putative zinc-binding oxidoreductase ToxD [Talaromyces proteolyticus]|uniref:Zinc-binding oxidoreductase ToxD n=1 Tax=Talaromyces proteolyticus TaxID=1131652 RepID=A0AAD4KJ68_9EURO|nr:putative zinc-binding oxidoreductase ToxD [Talaromyces proteolyticus]KAH8692259.1 putative zinc-binding oxidoreductase ToxD [Talaromyces proteolyticus]